MVEEIRTLRESLKKARAEFSDLQSEVREVRSTETTNKVRVSFPNYSKLLLSSK